MPSQSSTAEEILASSLLIPHRLQVSLADPASLALLHRSQWQCLATSYSLVLQSLSGLLDQARFSLMDQPSEEQSMCRKLSQPLHALHLAMTEGEICMHESLPSSYGSMHSWLAQKALAQSMSTEVVDVHLHHLMCTFWAVCEQIVRAASHSFDDMVFCCMLQLTRELWTLWACADTQDDVLGAQRFVGQIKREEEGEACCQLADFFLQKLSFAESSTCIMHDVALPPFLWIDPEVLQRNPNTLGEGGYGRVHEALWLGGRFAVKDFFYVENNEVFGREAFIQAQLRHPNVLPLVCCTRIPSFNKCSLVMELMQQDLRVLMMQRMAAGMDPPFSLIVAVDLMLQIARGMEYLHSDNLRIIHRDLKSSNILVSFSGRAELGRSVQENDVNPLVHLKVGDFGMSKAKYASSKYTTRPVGTTPWRAPEVFIANSEDESGLQPNAKYTNKADVYSFALVCYEILTGKSPFEGTQIQRRVLAGERPRLPYYCPPALASYIQTCWHAEPTRRPSFPQICRMLRYLKACILLRDQLEHSRNVDWLLHPMPPAMCDRMDNMRQSIVQQFDCNLQSQPVVLIPLEMYCCGKILQNISYTEANDNQFALTSSEEISSSNPPLTSEETGTASQIPDDRLLENQRNGVEHAESRRPSKVYLARTFRWLKRLSCWQGKLENNSEFQDALSLTARGFTYTELAAATNNFSNSSLIGRGGSGVVYSGRLEDGRSVAVKRTDYGAHRTQMWLTQELRIASQLRHRNVVPLFGWCQAREKLLLVYEYMPNGDLAQHIFRRGGRVVEWEVRYKVVNQLAAALKYLHQDSGYNQIVHRDVKTSNIMVDSEWNARLGDCGLALLLEAGHSSADSMVAGTFGYLAPEYLMNGSLSPAVDIYSFGMTVLEIVTGRRVFAQELSSAREIYLASWVWALHEQGCVMQAADTRLEGRFEEVEMERLLMLALTCTNEIPETRPNIEEVLSILSGLSQPPPPGPSPNYHRQVQPLTTTSSWSSIFLTMPR